MRNRRPGHIATPVSLMFSLLLVMQGMMPAGYMPAHAGSGWLVMLCPEGLPAGFPATATTALSRPHDHAPQHSSVAAHERHVVHGTPDPQASSEHAGHDSGADFCPLGDGLQTPTLPTLAALPTAPALPVPQRGATYHAPTLRRQPGAARPRAPPIS